MIDTVNMSRITGMADMMNEVNTLESVDESAKSKESLFRQTQDMIRTLGDEQLEKVYVFTASLMEMEDNPFKPVSKEQVLADLDESDADIEAGRIKDAHQAINDIRNRLGMSV